MTKILLAGVTDPSGLGDELQYVIGGDSDYAGYLFFKTALSRDYTRVLLTTLDIHTFNLFGFHDINSIINCIRRLVSNNIRYLVL
jgi:hypothetical protein